MLSTEITPTFFAEDHSLSPNEIPDHKIFYVALGGFFSALVTSLCYQSSPAFIPTMSCQSNVISLTSSPNQHKDTGQG